MFNIMEDLQEEILYLRNELNKELQSLSIAVASGITNLEQNKLHGLPEFSVLSRGVRITTLIERLIALDKISKV